MLPRLGTWVEAGEIGAPIVMPDDPFPCTVMVRVIGMDDKTVLDMHYWLPDREAAALLASGRWTSADVGSVSRSR